MFTIEFYWSGYSHLHVLANRAAIFSQLLYNVNVNRKEGTVYNVYEYEITANFHWVIQIQFNIWIK